MRAFNPLQLIFSERKQLSLITICEDLYTPQLVICKFQINNETNIDVAKIYLQMILTPSQLVRNNNDDIKLSLKTFLQEVKGFRYSINCERLCRHYKIIYDQIFISLVVILYIIFAIFYYLFILYHFCLIIMLQ